MVICWAISSTFQFKLGGRVSEIDRTRLLKASNASAAASATNGAFDGASPFSAEDIPDIDLPVDLALITGTISIIRR